MYLQKPFFLLALALFALSACTLPIESTPGAPLDPRTTQSTNWLGLRWKRSAISSPNQDANKDSTTSKSGWTFPKPGWTFPPSRRSINLDARKNENLDVDLPRWTFPRANGKVTHKHKDHKGDGVDDALDGMASWTGWNY